MGERISVIRKGKVKMKDFQLRNDTKLMFRNDSVQELCKIVKNKKVLFVYGGGSVKKNGCYADVKNASKSEGFHVLWMHTMPFLQDAVKDVFNYSDRIHISVSDFIADGFRRMHFEDPYEAMAEKHRPED